MYFAYKLKDVFIFTLSLFFLYCVLPSQSLALVQDIIVKNKLATETLDLSYSPLF